MLEVLVDVEHNEFLYEQKSKPAGERRGQKYACSVAAHVSTVAEANMYDLVEHHCNVKPDGSEARGLYEKAVKALTLLQLADTKAAYSPQAAEYLGMVPDDAQYIAACGELHDESVNSTVEATNFANNYVRQEFATGVHLTVTLLTLVKECARRFYENKGNAHAATGPLHSAMLRKLEDVAEKAATINSGVSFVSRNVKSVARVESTS
ncbi:hypothetical protein CYMTET_7358 [Cymbomonas tetramitiformis]|uniref:Uncharacterized protein n=1 Tax=Cymbomonas tetramitiformis TaxID=36881 RepID=A0AAE0GVN3_9CHLO|nr:hypothetical protein CYMTET_7358 [Cymbomonas tetramitiformis]